MEPKLVLQFAQHRTTKAMWKSLVTTFGVRADPVQVYDLEIQTNKATQRDDTLEEYWSELQNLWVNINARKPCPYTCCDKRVNIYIKETETKRLYQFLARLNDRYDGLRREIFKISDISAEEAFGIVKQEEGRTTVWRPTAKPTDPVDTDIGAGIGTRNRPSSPYPQNRAPAPPHHRVHPPLPPRRNPPNRRSQIDKSRLFCTHCGMHKHTNETCFKLIGFPEWWEDDHKLNHDGTAKGRAVVGREDNDGLAVPMGNQAVTNTGNDGSLKVEPPIGGGWWPTGAEGGEGETAERAKARVGKSTEGIGFGNSFPKSTEGIGFGKNDRRYRV